MVEVRLDHAYAGWKKNARLTNGKVELIATTEVGPRIIRFGFLGGPNELFENAPDLGRTGDASWRPYGGHRLWHAPEEMPRTYSPDNEAVASRYDAGALILQQAVEPSTGIQKTIELRMHESRAEVSVLHRLENRGAWPVRLAAWALTVMAPGGSAIVPLGKYVPFPEQLGPARPLVLWSYTNLDDPRLIFDARFLRLRQDSRARAPTKIGACVDEGWAGYQNGDRLFIKRFAAPSKCATYPDFGSNVECFTNAEMLELETLSPLVVLERGACVEHLERWMLFDRVPPLESDATIVREIALRIS